MANAVSSVSRSVADRAHATSDFASERASLLPAHWSGRLRA
jgi:hypothetical protein